MKSKEEIEQLAKIYVESDIKKNQLYGQFHKTYTDGYTQCQEDMVDKKYTESQLRDAIRNTITYLATLSETGKFHSGNIIEEAIIQSLNKQD